MRLVNLGFVAATLLLGASALATSALADDVVNVGNGNGNSGIGNGNGNGNGQNGNGNGNHNGNHNGNNSLNNAGNTGSSNNSDNNTGSSSSTQNSQRNPVSTAVAVPLVATEDTCMGSSSIGGQGVGFGLSIGTTWDDDNCRRLKNSRQLVALGFPRAAVALMCMDDEVKTAMRQAGAACPEDRKQSSEAEPAPVTTRTASANTTPAPEQTPSDQPKVAYVPMDPIPDSKSSYHAHHH